MWSMSTGLKNFDMFDKITHNDKQQLQYAVNNQKPYHAYVFTGAGDLILTQCALEFICELICAANITVDKQLLMNRLTDGFYPDLLTIEKENQTVKAESIRRIRTFLQLKSQENPYKIALVHNSELMSDVAQNALLKTLEEPFENSIIILLSETTQPLLPTVLSRVQIINSIQNEFFQSLNENELDYIMNMLQEIFMAGSVNAIFNSAAAITKDKNKTNDYLNTLFSFFTDIVYYKAANEIKYSRYDDIRLMSDKISTRCAMNISKHIQDTLRYIKQNASLLLAVEAMLIKMQEEYHAENSRS